MEWPRRYSGSMSDRTDSDLSVLIVTAGSHGDVFPFLAIGTALAARGASVHVLVNPHFEPEVTAAGLSFLPFGERMGTADLIHQYGIMHPFLGSQRVMSLLLELAPISVSRCREVIEQLKPDVVLGHHICIGVDDVAGEFGVPCALAMLAPGPLFSRCDPVPTTQGIPGFAGRALAAIAEPLVQHVAFPLGSRALNRTRVKCGLEPAKNAFMNQWLGGDLLLGMWSEAFRAPQRDDPPHFRTCGFPLYDAPPGTRLDPRVDAFLAAGDPPLLFCLGSTAVHIAGSFYDDAIAVAKSLGRRALVLAGPNAAQYQDRGDDVGSFSYAPLSLVASHCAASVIHGGIGTTSQALAAGKPTLVASFAHDQFNNGVRVEALGVGDTLPVRRLTRARLERRLRRLLDTKSIVDAAATLGERIRRDRGGEFAAQAVLDLARA